MASVHGLGHDLQLKAMGPPCKNRCRQRMTVGRLVFSSWAILRLAIPVEAISTKRDRYMTWGGQLRAAIQDSSVRRCSAEMESESATSHIVREHIYSSGSIVNLFVRHLTESAIRDALLLQRILKCRSSEFAEKKNETCTQDRFDLDLWRRWVRPGMDRLPTERADQHCSRDSNSHRNHF